MEVILKLTPVLCEMYLHFNFSEVSDTILECRTKY